jgi:formylglycine-generating enzyme required for sulfatase activity
MLPGGSIPGGAGKWQHQDLAGNVSEWVLDVWNPNWYMTYATSGSCDDCANLTDGTLRVARSGGTFASSTTQAFIDSYARGAFRDSGAPPDSRSFAEGVRCARTPLGLRAAPSGRQPRREMLASRGAFVA